MRPVRVTTAVIMLGALTCTGFAHADEETAKSPLSGVYACASLTNDAQRLACYDEQVQQLKTAEAKGDMVAVDKGKVQAIEREAFGFSLPSLPKLRVPGLAGMLGMDHTATVELSKDKVEDSKTAQGAVLAANKSGEITKIGFAISRIGSTPNGYRFYLDNGQVWDQVSGGRTYIPKPRKGETMIAEIRKASMGSFLLTVNGRGQAIRVRRVQ